MPKLPVFARRALCAVSVFGGGLFLTYGCGTDAVGVDACRQIEEARCDAAPACTGDDDTFGIRTEEQVRNCKALYRDQCLHGIENAGGSDEDEVDEPSDGDVDRCIKAIKATAKCNKNKTDEVFTMEELCPDVALVSGWTSKSPCQTLNSVEKLDACKFVAKKDNSGDDGDTTATSSGSGGAGGSGGGG